MGQATGLSFERSGDALGDVQDEVVASTPPEDDPMILVFDTSHAAGTAIDLSGHLAGSNLEIDWGDGTVNSSTAHDWGTDGTYTVRISGDLTGYGSTDLSGVEDEMLVAVTGFAEVLTSLENGFFGAARNITMPAILPAGVTTLESAFYAAASFNQDISSWSVSAVTSMRNMFRDADAFNQDLNAWAPAQLVDARAMFSGADAFDGPIDQWTMSNLTLANEMFSDATSFDQPLDSWGGDLGGLSQASDMFAGATAFNQTLDSWVMTSVTDADGMFDGASAFNGEVGSWIFPSATAMDRIFRNAVSFDRDLSGWCVPNIPVQPGDFDTGAASWGSARPGWGTACP